MLVHFRERSREKSCQFPLRVKFQETKFGVTLSHSNWSSRNRREQSLNLVSAGTISFHGNIRILDHELRKMKE